MARKTKKEYDAKWNSKHVEQRREINRQNYLGSREQRLAWNKKNRRKHLYEYYERNAVARGYEFELTREQFDELINEDCCYCGNNDNIGVDRVDNNIGYVYWNCVPCCGVCNKMKGVHTQDEFIDHCKRVASYCK